MDLSVVALIFVLDLHLRSGLYAFFILLMIKFFGWLDTYLQALPYLSKYDVKISKRKECFRKLVQKVSSIFCYPKSTAHSKQRGKGLRISSVSKLFTYIKSSIWHPWNIITEYNEIREILLVDVVDTKYNLFSGVFSSWLPQGNSDFSSISLSHVLHFYSEEDLENKQNQENIPCKRYNEEANLNSPKHLNKKIRLIRNQGTFLIEKDKLINLHFWELRRGTSIKVDVSDRSSFERLKWYLGLLHLYPNYFQKLTAIFTLKNEVFQDYVNELKVWLDRDLLDLPMDKISYIHKKVTNSNKEF